MDLSAVRIFVRDLKPARTFYEKTLGLAMTSDGGGRGFSAFKSNGIDLIIEIVPSAGPQEDQALVGRFSGVSFAVPDIHAECRRLVSEGVSICGEPEKQSWGGWLATFKDPAGNQLQLVQYLDE